MERFNKITIALVFFLLTSSLAFSFGSAEISKDDQNIRVIKIAQYPRATGSDMLFELIFNYSWKTDDTIYKFTCTELSLEEVMGGGEQPLNISNFDLLVVGVSSDYWKQREQDPKLGDNVKEFLSKGGGYLGVCAGTRRASQGYKDTNKLYKKHVNKCLFKIANVYANSDFEEEQQYIYKYGRDTGANQGLPPIENKVVRNNMNPIFTTYPQETINITYGGGPSLSPANASDPLLGEITPLLVINEELMDTKPIHWWKKMVFGWKKDRKVKTDMEGQYGGIATTYGLGRVVIFTCEPEIILILNGTIEEYVGRSTGYGFRFNPIRVVYSWAGTRMNMSRNWWIHRRAAAWIAGVPDEKLPPANELMVFMDKPQFRLGHQLYFKDHQVGKYFNFSLLEPPFNFPRIENSRLLGRIMGKIVSRRLLKVVAQAGMTVIVGDITVEAYSENSDRVEFYLDGKLEYTDTEQPFEWVLDKNNLNGVHRLELRAYDEYGNYACDGSEFFFINT